MFACFERCIFELFAAVKGKTELICQYRSGFAVEAEAGLEEHPVKSEEAKCSKDADAELINGYIRKLEGGHQHLDEQLTKAILESNTRFRAIFRSGSPRPRKPLDDLVLDQRKLFTRVLPLRKRDAASDRPDRRS